MILRSISACCLRAHNLNSVIFIVRNGEGKRWTKYFVSMICFKRYFMIGLFPFPLLGRLTTAHYSHEAGPSSENPRHIRMTCFCQIPAAISEDDYCNTKAWNQDNGQHVRLWGEELTKKTKYECLHLHSSSPAFELLHINIFKPSVQHAIHKDITYCMREIYDSNLLSSLSSHSLDYSLGTTLVSL